jgi:starvation-inducible DNA-binding protein
MNPTLNDLSRSDRKKLVELLNEQLADCGDLFTQVKQAHWNVKGPAFIALHKLFDEVAEAVEDYADEIAERAVQLGGVANGTARDIARNSRLREYPHDIASGQEHARALAGALAAFGASTRKAIDKADKLGDKCTADLFTEVSRGLDKWVWFVEAHLHAKS